MDCAKADVPQSTSTLNTMAIRLPMTGSPARQASYDAAPFKALRCTEYSIPCGDSGMYFALFLSEGCKTRVKDSERSRVMYVSRLTFHTNPGQTHVVEQELQTLLTMVDQVGGGRPRVLRNHFASLGAPD